jgi:hypothetical protein
MILVLPRESSALNMEAAGASETATMITRLHGITFQATVFVVTAMRSSYYLLIVIFAGNIKIVYEPIV